MVNSKKRTISLVILAIAIIFIIVFIVVKLSLPNIKHDVYDYAIECVDNKLGYPSSADFSSYKETTIEKTSKNTEIIAEAYRLNKTYDKAWEVSGDVTYKIGGFVREQSFNVTVVLSQDGDFWCYECFLI